MFKFKQKTIFPLCTLALGVLWVWLGISEYEFWNKRTGPGSSFFPVIVASVLIVFSLFAVWMSAREEPAKYDVEVLHLLSAVIGVVVSTYLFGMLYSLFAFVVLWMKFYEKLSLKTTLIATAVLGLIVYATFVYWLQVPFPEGIVFETTEL